MSLPINIITALAYYALAGFFVYQLKKSKGEIPDWSKFLPFIPMGLHLYSLYLAIETGAGQDLSLFNLLSLVGFVLVFIVALYRFRHKTPHLMMYVSLIAAFCLLISLIPHQTKVLQLTGDIITIVHIWLAVISFSLLLMASTQSFLLLMLDNKLRTQPAKIHPLMPPLLQMEQFNFDLVLIGVIGLGAALILGFFLPPEIIKAQALHKIILTIIAWFSFCTFILMYKSGKISGIQFARLTLIAFALLALGFVGSKLVIEFILQRG